MRTGMITATTITITTMTRAASGLVHRPCRELGALPLPIWGEGGGEGVTTSIDLNPSPHPSPYGRGSRPSQPRVSGSVRASEVGTCGAIHASPSSDRHCRPPRSPAERHAADRFQIAADRRRRSRSSSGSRWCRSCSCCGRASSRRRPRRRRRNSRSTTFARPISRARPRACSSIPFKFAVGAAVFALVVGTALAWMNERTNTPFKTLFFALSHHPAGDPGHPVHGVVDHAGEPQDRPHQPRAAEALRHRHGLRRHLYHDRHDLGRRAALFADGVPADDARRSAPWTRRWRNPR